MIDETKSYEDIESIASYIGISDDIELIRLFSDNLEGAALGDAPEKSFGYMVNDIVYSLGITKKEIKVDGEEVASSFEYTYWIVKEIDLNNLVA